MVWYLIVLIFLTIVINKILLFYGFDNLTYKMEISKKTAEIGEEIEISSIVENNKLLTVSFLKIHENFPKGFNKMNNIYTLLIMPYQRVKRIYKIHGLKRGLYNINDVKLELGDFVGFKTKSAKYKLNNEIIILPKRIELADSIEPIGFLNGDISVKRWILDDPLMTIGIREYTGNEPERYIHWPSSIKHSKLMVKNFDFTTDNSVLVLLNLETMKPSWKPLEEEILEKSISLTRGIMEEFEKLKIPYGFASNAYNRNSHYEKGYFFHPGLGQSHLNNLIEILGQLDYRIPTFFETTLKEIRKRQGNFTTVVIITPRVLDTYIEPINLLNKTLSRTVVVSIEEGNLEKLSKNIIKYRSK